MSEDTLQGNAPNPPRSDRPDPMIPMDDLAAQYAVVPDKSFRYCPGCGLGMAQSAILRAFHRLQLDPSKVATTGGSGCYAIMAHYFKSNHHHGSHGRGCAVATGMKLARPELTVITLQGDGDLLSIGGNHFIHAARRNLDITVICFNNFGYGDTGGQYAATTPAGSITDTSPYGMPEEPFDPCQLAIGAGASFAARSTVAHPVHLTRVISEAIAWKGFAFVEVLQHCHVLWGRRNGMPEAMDMILHYKENAVHNRPGLDDEDKAGKFVLGVLHREARPEFGEHYARLRERVQSGELRSAR